MREIKREGERQRERKSIKIKDAFQIQTRFKSEKRIWNLK